MITIKPNLSIVLATYNEKGNIGILISNIEEILKKEKINFEIIVVDDNSPDCTAAIVETLQKKFNNIKLIERTHERGLASALLKGFGESEGEIIATLDSDLAHDPQYLPSMIRLIKEQRADCIIGSRYLKESRFIGKPIHKKLASKCAQKIANIILKIPIKDTTNNFRVFKKGLYEDIKNSLHPKGNVMLAEFLYRAYKKGYTIKEIPTCYIERRKGTTKLSLFKETKNFLKMIWRIKNGR